MKLFKKLDIFLFSPLLFVSLGYFIYLNTFVPNFDKSNHFFMAIPCFYLSIKFYLMRQKSWNK